MINVCVCAVRVQCDECKKTFRDRWFLKQHQRVHSEARVVFLCPRDGCKRSYTTAFNLQSHILSFHEQQRTFSCTEPGCTKTFSMKVLLLCFGCWALFSHLFGFRYFPGTSNQCRIELEHYNWQLQNGCTA